MSALLEVSGVAKRFGGVQAVKDVSFQVAPGAIKAVIGPNGAGKTTLFNLVSGFLAPDAGEIRFKGERVGGRRPHEIAARGISRTFQHIRLFAGMTAIENVMVGVHVRSRAGFLAGMLHLPWTWREERDIRRRALDAMRLLDIEALAGADATSLSYGQQRSVELARALAAEPELLLLDEPAAGLNMRETAELAALVCRIRDRGVTVLIVEHDVSLVMSVSDEIVVLSYREKIADADPETVQRDPDVVRVYRARTRMLRVRNLDAGYGPLAVLRRVSLHVSAGEIVTLIGANGAGKTTLLKTITGLVRARGGEIAFRGEDVPP